MTAEEFKAFLQEIADIHGIDIELCQHIISNDTASDTAYVTSATHLLLRRASRLRTQLGVNNEGIEVIMQMRERLERMEEEMQSLRRQLQHYEKAYLPGKGSDITEL